MDRLRESLRGVVHYMDALLWIEILLAGAALYISSHGVYTFYAYLMTPDMAIAATVVLSVGIPVMEAAWLNARSQIDWLARSMKELHEESDKRAVREAIDRVARDQGFFFWFMMALLVVETFSQYFQGQAVFESRVVKAFQGVSTTIDLVTLAQHPVMSRVLTGMYLASITLGVFFIIRAATLRFLFLRDTWQQRIHAVQAAMHTQDTLKQWLIDQFANYEQRWQRESAAMQEAMRQRSESLIKHLQDDIATSHETLTQTQETLVTEIRAWMQHTDMALALQVRENVCEGVPSLVLNGHHAAIGDDGVATQNLSDRIRAVYREATNDGRKMTARDIALVLDIPERESYVAQVLSRYRKSLS